jgi:predicted RNA methylase
VIENVADSWLSIAGAGCGLTSVGASEEQARKVVADKASRFA